VNSEAFDHRAHADRWDRCRAGVAENLMILPASGICFLHNIQNCRSAWVAHFARLQCLETPKARYSFKPIGSLLAAHQKATRQSPDRTPSPVST